MTKAELIARLKSRACGHRRSAEAALADRDLVRYERAVARAEAYELAAYDAEELEEPGRPAREKNETHEPALSKETR